MEEYSVLGTLGIAFRRHDFMSTFGKDKSHLCICTKLNILSIDIQHELPYKVSDDIQHEPNCDIQCDSNMYAVAYLGGILLQNA